MTIRRHAAGILVILVAFLAGALVGASSHYPRPSVVYVEQTTTTTTEAPPCPPSAPVPCG